LKVQQLAQQQWAQYSALDPFVHGGGSNGFGFRSTFGTGVKVAPLVVIPEMALAKWTTGAARVGALADDAVRAAKTSKAIVIGEGMGAVKTTAKTLQSQGINAKWYQAWSKNFPTNRLMTPAELSAAKARNARWLNKKINQGYKIYDIGIDATRATRSPFYQLERSILQQRGYPITVLRR